MRSSILLATALAIVAIAGPIQKRKIVTELEVEVVTKTVFVTATRPHKTKVTSATSTGYRRPPPPPPPATPTTTTKTPVVTEQPQQPQPTSAKPSPPAEKPNGSHPTGAAQATLQSGPDYQAAVLYHHNAARANHGAQPLVWDADCEAGARRTADTCVFQHPSFLGELRQGQNLFTTSGDAFNVTAAITESWYKGELGDMMPYFGSADIPEDAFHGVGHLTQLVWKDTTKVGCVSVDCGNRMKLGSGASTDMNKFTICNYANAGNVGGRYAENVGAPISTTNLGSWLD